MTVQELIKSVRYRIRDTDQTNFIDDEIITYLNELLNGCYSTMQNVESVLVFGEDKIQLIKEQPCYDVPFEHNGFLDEGVWIGGSVKPLVRTTYPAIAPFLESGAGSGIPGQYYLKDGQVCLFPPPREDGELNVVFWNPFEPLNQGSVIPWEGYWDKYLVKATTIECLERQERDVSQQAIMVAGLFDEAIGEIMKLGVRSRRMRSDMFTARGC